MWYNFLMWSHIFVYFNFYFILLVVKHPVIIILMQGIGMCVKNLHCMLIRNKFIAFFQLHINLSFLYRVCTWKIHIECYEIMSDRDKVRTWENPENLLYFSQENHVGRSGQASFVERGCSQFTLTKWGGRGFTVYLMSTKFQQRG